MEKNVSALKHVRDYFSLGLDFPKILPAKVCGEGDVFVLERVLVLECVLLLERVLLLECVLVLECVL